MKQGENCVKKKCNGKMIVANSLITKTLYLKCSNKKCDFTSPLLDNNLLDGKFYAR